MKPRSIIGLSAAVLLLTLSMSAWAQRVEVGQAIQHGVSPPIRDIAQPVVPRRGVGERVVPIGERPNFDPDPSNATPDTGRNVPGWFMEPTPPPIVSASGLSDDDNAATVGFRVVPPDTNGDIGLDGLGARIYIQYINSTWAVFNEDGVMVEGPFAGNTFWQGIGGPCEANNDGDPVVLYDDYAGRWFFSQFSIGEGTQCVAVSQTSDPLGPYFLYVFVVTPGGNNDYPKLGVWTDGAGQSAYTFTLRDFGGAGGPFSVSAGVMDRDAMLAGAPATFQKFSNPCKTDGSDCIEGQLPPHMAGALPPAGTCPTFWTAVDGSYDEAPGTNDGYRNHTLCVDWANPANTTYTEGPMVVAGSNFDRFLLNGFSDCIDSVPAPGEVLDCLAAFTMYRAQYRWYGDNARVVLNTTVDAGGDRAGIRWAEVRSNDGDSGWFLQQDGTFAPDDGLDRWMGSIAADQDGNIALGYSVTGPGVMPAVRYTTRTSGDPLGTLPGGEVSCHEGTGVQTGSSNRWGDYSSMSVDPTDDCTFWYTQEYYETTGSFDFNTRICSFKFPGCGGVCEPTEDPEETCNDGLDNDCDGDIDCTDTDCADDPACACIPEPEICTDGIDNDCDGFVDCDDPDCDPDPACAPPETPENDLCVDAIPVECGQTISGTTNLATFDDVGFCGTSNTAPGVWYSVAYDGYITASTCNQATYDTKLTAFAGECGALGCIDGNDDAPGCSGFTSELTWDSDGSDNLLLVHGFSTATGDFDLTVSCEPRSDNDICEEATGPLGPGDIVTGSTNGASIDEPPDIDCGTPVTAPGVWYDVIGTGNTMTASVCNDGDPSTGGADFDTKISVYCADCEIKQCIGGQDDNPAECSGFTSKFSWPTEAGATYKVLVHGFASATGIFDLAILDNGVPAEGASSCVAFDKFIVDGPDQDFDGRVDKVVEADSLTGADFAFGIRYQNARTDAPPAVEIRDMVPREWNVVQVPITPVDCNIIRADERRNLFSDNWIYCPVGQNDEMYFEASARCGTVPGDPTCHPFECGGFYINPEGAEAWVGRTPVWGPTNPLCVAGVKDIDGGGLDYSGAGDEDGDGRFDYTEACLLGTDPCDPASVSDEILSCGDCVESHSETGCSNFDCEVTVCDIDPWCCNVNWDFICVNEAIDFCVADDICTLDGPVRPAAIPGGRTNEPVSKDPNFTPKE